MSQKAVVYALLLVATMGVGFCVGAGWNYDNPNRDWPAVSKVCGSGTRQSPIDINNAVYDPKLPELEYVHSIQNYKISNNGHTIQVNPQRYDTPMNVTYGGTTYVLWQCHFHWGHEDHDGSEHLLRSHAFPLELHCVHVNKKYQKATEATEFELVENTLNNADALLVVGTFFKIGAENHALNSILSHVTDVAAYNSSAGTSIEPVSDVINWAAIQAPEISSKFYTYPGSLTTPPCSEAVTWIVAHYEREVSSHQMEILRTAKHDMTTPIHFNFRPVQPLNGRTIKASFVPMDSGVAANYVSFVFIVCSGIFTLLF